jgi:hypothetical protein
LLTPPRVLLTVWLTPPRVLLTVLLAPPVPGRVTLGTRIGEDPDEPPPEEPPLEPPELPGALVVEDPDPPPPEPPEPPEPPLPAPVPVEPRSAPGVDPRPESDPTEEPVLLVSADSALFDSLGSVGSVLAEAGAAGAASGPLVSVARPPATPERLAPNPIRTATATGTAPRAAPAMPDEAVRRCHQASSPFPIENLLDAFLPKNVSRYSRRTLSGKAARSR